MASPTVSNMLLELHDATKCEMVVRAYRIPDSAMIRDTLYIYLALPIALASCATRKIR